MTICFFFCFSIYLVIWALPCSVRRFFFFGFCPIFTYVFIFYRSAWEQDLHIGLHHYVSPCDCAILDGDECDICRGSWSWSTEATMTWWHWQDNEPGLENCGRLTATSAWAENSCNTHMKFICERGNGFILHIADPKSL